MGYIKKTKKAEVLLEYQNYIESPPVRPNDLYAQACSNDTITVNTWRAQWLSQYKSNSKTYGPFREKTIGEIRNTQKYKPIIIAGSGPSLKRNVHDLKNKGDICLVSCLHNFHLMEDNEVKVDYYVTLDAGDVTVAEVSEGGSKSAEQYWAMTKDKTLLAFCATHPTLLEKWQGKVYFYNCPIPDPSYMKEIDEFDPFHVYVSNGGNVLGACLYIARGILGGNPIAFTGADFAFSYEHKFHAWDSKYDANLGQVMKCIDVFGNKVLSWRSYQNFKGWFEWVAMSIPGLFINCTEGGTFGAYPEGNIMAIKQMDLEDFIRMYEIHESLKASIEAPLGIRNDKGELERTILF